MDQNQANNRESAGQHEPARHISMELKADSARVTNLTMDGSRLILTIEAELSSSQVKAGASSPATPAPATTAPKPFAEQDTAAVPPPSPLQTGPTPEHHEQASSAADTVEYLPESLREQATEPFPAKRPTGHLDQVFSLGVAEEKKPVFGESGGAGIVSSYQSAPFPDPDACPAPSLQSAGERLEAAASETPPQPDSTPIDHLSYEMLENQIRKLKGRETSVRAKERPYGEDESGDVEKEASGAEAVEEDPSDTVFQLDGGMAGQSATPTDAAQAQDGELFGPKALEKTETVHLGPSSDMPGEAGEEEDTLAAIHPPQPESPTTNSPEGVSKPASRADAFAEADLSQIPPTEPASAPSPSERENEDVDTATQAITYESSTGQDVFVPPFGGDGAESAEESSTEHIDYEAKVETGPAPLTPAGDETPTAPEQTPEAAEESSADPSFRFEVADDDSEAPSLGQDIHLSSVEEEEEDDISLPGPGELMTLKVLPSDLDDAPVLSEESSAMGGDRHGEPLPSMTFGFSPSTVVPERAPTPEAADEPSGQTAPQIEDEPAPEPAADAPEDSFPPENGDEPAGDENAGAPTASDPGQMSPGGTTVLIRYTCPKCKTQGMQAVDKVGCIVNCTNCGKAMRLVMKK